LNQNYRIGSVALSLFCVAVLVLLPSQHGRSCTAFVLCDSASVTVAKNLDWPIGDGFVMVNPRGLSKYGLASAQGPQARWISRYGSISFNQFGREFPLGGMNEAGLVVEETSFSPSVYPSDDGRPTVNEFQWIQYQLDNFASVSEVVDNVSGLRIKKQLAGIHFLVVDAKGACAVIEFIAGKALVYTGQNLPAAVLANNEYANAIKYLKCHRRFGGERVPTSGPESPERFVRAASMLQDFPCLDHFDAGEYAFRILENVRQTDTQWSIVYDAVNLTARFIIPTLGAYHRIELTNLDFSCQRQPLMLDLKCLASNQESVNWDVWTRSRNSGLLRSVFQQFREHEGPANDVIDAFLNTTAFSLSHLQCSE